MTQHPALINLGDSIGSEINTASYKLQKLGPAVSIFGGARVKKNSVAYIEAFKLAEKLAEYKVAVISGGGPGIMEAANQGAHASGGISVGLNIVLPHEQSGNPFQTISVPFSYFPSRKATFTEVSDGFVAFEGGFGTIDEIFEILTLVQTGKNKKSPIILVGQPFWEGLLKWICSQMIPAGVIGKFDTELVTIAKDAEHAFELLKPTLDNALMNKKIVQDEIEQVN